MENDMFVQYIARRAMYNILGTLGTHWLILQHKLGVPRENDVFICQYMAFEEVQTW